MRRLACILALLLLLGGTAAAADRVLAAADYPEGPLWHHGRLYYAEMMKDRIVVSDLQSTSTFWRLPGCGPVSVAPYRGDEILVLCHLIHRVVRVSAEGESIQVIAHDGDGRPFVHPNDSSADGKGGVYFTASGEFALAAPATGAVLHLAADGTLRRLAGGIRYSNGIAFDGAHHRLLVSEHLDRRILAYPLRADGGLGPPQVFFDFERLPFADEALDPLAGPDGLELTDDGRLIVAEYGAGRIHLVSPAGAWLGTLGGFQRYVTDMALLPGGRAAVTEASVNDVPPFPGQVAILDDFLGRFRRP
jgi:sugar lactone lactonase YvrE